MPSSELTYAAPRVHICRPVGSHMQPVTNPHINGGQLLGRVAILCIIFDLRKLHIVHYALEGWQRSHSLA